MTGNYTTVGMLNCDHRITVVWYRGVLKISNDLSQKAKAKGCSEHLQASAGVHGNDKADGHVEPLADPGFGRLDQKWVFRLLKYLTFGPFFV